MLLVAFAENRDVVLRVEDNGIGIAPEQLSKIFEPWRSSASWSSCTAEA